MPLPLLMSDKTIIPVNLRSGACRKRVFGFAEVVGVCFGGRDWLGGSIDRGRIALMAEAVDGLDAY